MEICTANLLMFCFLWYSVSMVNYISVYSTPCQSCTLFLETTYQRNQSYSSKILCKVALSPAPLLHQQVTTDRWQPGSICPWHFPCIVIHFLFTWSSQNTSYCCACNLHFFCALAEDFNKRLFASEVTEYEEESLAKEVSSSGLLVYQYLRNGSLHI